MCSKDLWIRLWSLEAFCLKASQALATGVGSCRCCFTLSSFATSGAVTLFTMKQAKWWAHHEPFLTKYPFLPHINCSQGVTSLAAQLCAASSLAHYFHLVDWMWVVNIYRLQKLEVGHTWCMMFPVLCRERVTLAVDTATARALPWGLTLAFPFMLSSLKCSPSKWLQDWICRFSSWQNAVARTDEQNSLSCQWAAVSLKPDVFNMRDYSCSYFLAFFLL